jgi:hypothetical protein
MRIFIESLSRLYLEGKITKEKLGELLQEHKITEEEYQYILNQ